jgi:hypothetical protein
MHTTIRQYRCDPSDVEEITRRVDETFADDISKLDGFDGYELVDCGNGTMFTITVFEDRETAERSTELAAAFIADKLGHIAFERVAANTGEVRVNRSGAHMMDLIHA